MKPKALKDSRAGFKLTLLGSAIATTLGSGWTGIAVAADAAASDQIVVTGSRIVRRDFEANSPIMTIDEELFEDTSTIGVETVLNQLPQFVPAVTQFDTAEVQGTATTTPGASTISLRGLGENRNLVLINGRRAMPINASGATDVNMIPSSAIQRVETITGGASSTYGADAMAGVVNFILKDDYEGLELSAQYGITQRGDDTNLRVNGLWGANFGDGDGNVMVGFEYTRRGEVMRADRDFYTEGWADPTTAGTATRLSEFQYAPSTAIGGFPSQAAVDLVFADRPTGTTVGRTGTFHINTDGTLYKPTADGSYRYNGAFTDQYGAFRKYRDDGTLAENQTDQLISIPLERFSFFTSATGNLTDTTKAFFQGTMAQNSNRTVLFYSPAVGPWGAAIPHGTNTYLDSLVDPNAADPATTATAPAFLSGGLYGLNCAPVGGCTDSEVFPVPAELATLLDSRANPNLPWRGGDVFTWAGARRSENTVTSYQMVGGFQGELPIQDWTWDASVSYGRTSVSTKLLGFGSVERYRAIITAPNYGRNFFFTGNEFGGGFGGGLGRCTTGLSFFDTTDPSEDCVSAVQADLQNQSDMQQVVVEANVQGLVAELPAGEMRYAAGVSYRRNKFDYLTDILVSQDSFLDSGVGLFPASNSNGKTSAHEIYGELLVPLLADLPMVESLELEAGYRYSDNNPSPNVDTYKALLTWTINDRIRLRGGHQVANRAPNIGELFLSRTQTLEVSFDGDYCSTRNPRNPFSANPAVNTNAAQVEAICRSLMGVSGADTFYGSAANQPNGSTVFGFQNLVGNPNLKNESAKTYTLGAVINPIDSLSLTIDWYQITISDLISAQTASSVYRLCMDPATNPTLDPAFAACQQIGRNPASGNAAPVDVTYSNEAWMQTSGIDIQANYNFDVWNGSMNFNVQASWLDSFKTRVNDDAVKREWVGSAGPNDVTGVNGGAFDFRTFSQITYSDNGGWNVTLRHRYLPELESASAVAGTTFIQPANDYHMFDLSGGWRFGDDPNYLIRFGINNLFDTKPNTTGRNTDPADPATGAGTTNSRFYDVLGRRFYVGFTAEF
ncbi:MAG: TonB-dependent receptor [Gammaproteobacteria bacterium]|nr:TonB-dependent receptor [Gammaproteobacteria bacterium]